jgi:hypothetical protein
MFVTVATLFAAWVTVARILYRGTVVEAFLWSVTSCSSHGLGPVLPAFAGFLNAYFPDWFELPSAHRLPYAYNAQRTLQWLTKVAPGYWDAVVAKGIKVLHFSSSPKPWQTKVSPALPLSLCCFASPLQPLGCLP